MYTLFPTEWMFGPQAEREREFHAVLSALQQQQQQQQQYWLQQAEQAATERGRLDDRLTREREQVRGPMCNRLTNIITRS
jgi:hypothetical protein